MAAAVPVATGLSSASAGAPPARAARSSPAKAIVEGEVLFCGGPETIPPRRGCPVEAISLCGPPQGCISADRVAVLDARGARVASQRLRQGRFRMRLQAGAYSIELLGDGKRVHGRVLDSEEILARAGHTTQVQFLWPRSP